jgi:hypothetical protein
MTRVVLLLSTAVLAAGQATTQSYIYDGAGNRSRGPDVDARGDARTERLQSINGRSVPLEKVEQRVISDDGRTRVVERVVQRFDQTGNPAGTERISEEQTKLGDRGPPHTAPT